VEGVAFVLHSLRFTGRYLTFWPFADVERVWRKAKDPRQGNFRSDTLLSVSEHTILVVEDDPGVAAGSSRVFAPKGLALIWCLRERPLSTH
jgi:hypothetical protein